MPTITQYQGESGYDAFLQYNGLNIEGEQSFLDWCDSYGYEGVAEFSATTLNMMYEKFLDEQKATSEV